MQFNFFTSRGTESVTGLLQQQYFRVLYSITSLWETKADSRYTVNIIIPAGFLVRVRSLVITPTQNFQGYKADTRPVSNRFVTLSGTDYCSLNPNWTIHAGAISGRNIHESSFQRRYLLPYPRWPGHTEVRSVRRMDVSQLSCSEDRCKQHNSTFRKW